MLLIVAGFVGLVLPALPGTPLIFAGLVLLAWAEDFAHVGGITLGVLGALALLSYVADFLAAALGAKRCGASPRAVAGAALGALVGVFFGRPGIVFGPFVGAVVGEFSRRTSVAGATRPGIGATLGLLFGTLLKNRAGVHDGRRLRGRSSALAFWCCRIAGILLAFAHRSRR